MSDLFLGCILQEFNSVEVEEIKSDVPVNETFSTNKPVQSPTISPVSTSPYIPISECISGTMPYIPSQGKKVFI